MKSKYITHLIFEGPDGVGKDTLSFEVWKKFNFKYRTYVRGEISDYVYAKKFGRSITTTQNGLPFLHIVLTASDAHIIRNINKRTYSSEKEHKAELKKVKDKALFLQAANELSRFYHILVVDVTDLDIPTATQRIIEYVGMYVKSMSNDSELNDFNKMYELGCKRAGYKLTVKGNQPFINDEMIMADAHLHNGKFETYDDRSYPHNLLFSFAYTLDNPNCIEFEQKDADFVYPINSKVLQRPEVYEYLAAFNKGDKSVLTTDSCYLPKMKNMKFMPKVFGDDYIAELSRAKATVYTSRDLASLEMMTVRAYESILAQNVIFVDIATDPQKKILKQIYDGTSLSKIALDLLYVTPNTIVQNYNLVMSNEDLVARILVLQRKWYKTLVDVYGVNYEIK